MDKFDAPDVSQLPETVKKAMKLRDFRGIFGSESLMTGEAGSTTTGKPLSLRDIRAVVTAVKDIDNANLKARLQDAMAESKNLPKAREEGHEFLRYDCSQGENPVDPALSIATFDKALKNLCSHFNGFNWNTTCSLPKFTALFNEISQQLKIVGATIRTQDRAMPVINLALCAYMRANPGFRNFIDRHQLRFEQLQNQFFDQSTVGIIFAFDQAKAICDACCLAEKLSLLPEKDRLAQLKEMGSLKICELFRITCQTSVQSISAAKPIRQMLAQLVLDLKPKLMQSTEKAATWIDSQKASRFELMEFLTFCADEILHDKGLSDKLKEIQNELNQRGIQDNGVSVNDKWSEEDDKEFGTSTIIDHGYELSAEYVDKCGHTYRTPTPNPGEYCITWKMKTTPPTPFYHYGRGCEVEEDKWGVPVRVIKGKLIHECWIDDKDGPKECLVKWHVDENGNPIDEKNVPPVNDSNVSNPTT